MNMIRFIILLLLVIPFVFISKGQARWTKIYYGEKDAYGKFFIESYDKGYLILGKHGHNAVHYNWLIKTDINGDKIWEKTFGNEISYITLGHMSMSDAGDLYLCGSERNPDDYTNPIIIKLDSCGEKQWCRIFYTPGILDYAFHILTTNDGGCITLLFSGQDNKNDRVCLARFDSIGELLWKECYNSQDTNLWNPFGQSFIQTQDGGFLITGYCYYEDPNQPGLGWVKPYYINTDSGGIFKWETVVHKDVGGEMGGSAWSTSIDPSGAYYYSSISHYYPESKSPALIKMDFDGNIIDIYDIVPGFEHGGLTYATFINDSILAAGVGWGNTEDDIMNYAGLIDTIGNIIDTTFLVQDIYTVYMNTAYDNKLLYMYNTYQNNQFDVYLRKLNQNLEDDTLYTYPFQYDTLCPYPIASDTIPLDDCQLIVGIEEPALSSPQEPEALSIYPNPASDIIHVRCSTSHVPCSILIYDLFGRKIEEIEIPQGQEKIQFNVSSYPRGIYIAVLRDEKRVIDRKKFIISR